MRAKPVNFERGLDPKEALAIGNENLRKFKKALDEGDFGISLDLLMNGLEGEYFSDADADEFITGGIRDLDFTYNYWEWPKWFYETKNIYWSKFNESLNINFSLPDFKRIKTWIGKITDAEGNYYYKMRTSSTDKNGSSYGISEENVFEVDDYMFTTRSILKQINKVFTSTVQNID